LDVRIQPGRPLKQ
jgi:hypothetical protein